jgi:hypothetical protein
MKDAVMIANDHQKIKVINWAHRLLDADIDFTYQIVGVQYCLTVEEVDVKRAYDVRGQVDFWTTAK